MFQRLGLVAALIALLWGWHVYDKQRAISAAREGFVREFELTAARAELEALRHRANAAARANRELQAQMQAAEDDAARFAAELEAYERDTTTNPDGIVDPGLLSRLRAN